MDVELAGEPSLPPLAGEPSLPPPEATHASSERTPVEEALQQELNDLIAAYAHGLSAAVPSLQHLQSPDIPLMRAALRDRAEDVVAPWALNARDVTNYVERYGANFFAALEGEDGLLSTPIVLYNKAVEECRLRSSRGGVAEAFQTLALLHFAAELDRWGGPSQPPLEDVNTDEQLPWPEWFQLMARSELVHCELQRHVLQVEGRANPAVLSVIARKLGNQWPHRLVPRVVHVLANHNLVYYAIGDAEKGGTAARGGLTTLQNVTLMAGEDAALSVAGIDVLSRAPQTWELHFDSAAERDRFCRCLRTQGELRKILVHLSNTSYGVVGNLSPATMARLYRALCDFGSLADSLWSRYGRDLLERRKSSLFQTRLRHSLFLIAATARRLRVTLTALHSNAPLEVRRVEGEAAIAHALTVDARAAAREWAVPASVTVAAMREAVQPLQAAFLSSLAAESTTAAAATRSSGGGDSYRSILDGIGESMGLGGATAGGPLSVDDGDRETAPVAAESAIEQVCAAAAAASKQHIFNTLQLDSVDMGYLVEAAAAAHAADCAAVHQRNLDAVALVEVALAEAEAAHQHEIDAVIADAEAVYQQEAEISAALVEAEALRQREDDANSTAALAGAEAGSSYRESAEASRQCEANAAAAEEETEWLRQREAEAVAAAAIAEAEAESQRVAEAAAAAALAEAEAEAAYHRGLAEAPRKRQADAAAALAAAEAVRKREADAESVAALAGADVATAQHEAAEATRQLVERELDAAIAEVDDLAAEARPATGNRSSEYLSAVANAAVAAAHAVAATAAVREASPGNVSGAGRVGAAPSPSRTFGQRSPNSLAIGPRSVGVGPRLPKR